MQRSRQDDRAGRGRLTVSLTATLPPVLQAACEKLAPWVAPRRHAACNFGLRGAAQSSVRALDRRHTLRPTSCVACSVSASFFSAVSARASALTTFSHVFTCAALLIELGYARIHCKRYLRPLMYEQSVMQTVMWGPRRVRSASNQRDSLRALMRWSTRSAGVVKCTPPRLQLPQHSRSGGGAAFQTFAVVSLQHMHGAPCTFGRLPTVGRPAAWPNLTRGIDERRGKRVAEARSGP